MTARNIWIGVSMEKEICKQYGFKNINLSRILTGVGAFTYLVETNCDKYILKGVPCNDNYIQNEPNIAEFLIHSEIPVAEYIKNKDGQYIWTHGGNQYHMQRFVDGISFSFNGAPDWFMRESAAMLGKIHTVLSGFKPLPVGMGDGFLHFMKSDHPQNSYQKTLEKARNLDHSDIATDVAYRLSLVGCLRNKAFDLSQFTCCNTHGDYKISQILCNNDNIAAIIDWTSACIHPVCWEIIRSFTYADPSCKDGDIDCDKLVEYVKVYIQYHPLNEYDLKMMPYFFYHQLLACDYYDQYYGASGANRDDFLFQAKFSTRLIRWFEKNADDLSGKLCSI